MAAIAEVMLNIRYASFLMASLNNSIIERFHRQVNPSGRWPGGAVMLISYKNGLAGLLVGVSFGFATIKILGSTQVRASLGDVASRLSLTQGHRSNMVTPFSRLSKFRAFLKW